MCPLFSETSVVFLAATGFLLGSFPTAYLAGKVFKKIDIRRHGSGNVGATNAFRVLGKPIGTLVFAVDFFKGYLPAFFSIHGMLFDMERAMVVGLAAIFGHIFSPFLGLRGGKGVATGAGVLTAVYPVLSGVGILAWVFSFFITRIVSISSLLAMSSIFIASFFMGLPLRIVLFFFFLLALIFWTHRLNLKRLLTGEEKKIG